MPAGQHSGQGQLIPQIIDGNVRNVVTHGRPVDPTKSDKLQEDNTKLTRPEGGTYDSNDLDG